MDSDGFHDLVQRARGGDRRAMDATLERMRPLLEPLARRYADGARPVESTADLIQESCLRAWNRIETFEGADNDEETFAMFRVWIGNIVRRLGMDAKRNHRRKKRSPDQAILRLGAGTAEDTASPEGRIDPPARGPSPSSLVRTDEEVARVRAALERIQDETNAAIVRLHFLEGLNLAEVGTRLGMAKETVRRRFWATMSELRGELDDS